MNACAASAGEPLFVDRSTLPVAHVYAGDWEHFVGGGVAVLDCDGDGFLDIAAAGGSNPARLFRNATREAGAPLQFELGELAPLTGVTGLYPLDIDGDAVLDLVVLRVGPNAILKGEGGCSFTDFSDAWSFNRGDAWSTAFSATWEPSARFPTLAIGNYVDRVDPKGPFEACDANELHRPEGGGYGEPISLEPGFCALSMLFSDWRRIGAPDLRISNDRHYYVRGGSEQMWQLEPLRELGPAEGFDPLSIWGMGIASHDLTGDGRPEVFLTSMGDQLLQIATETPGYRAAPFGIGTYAQRPHIGDDGRPSTGWHAEFGDVDNDGLADLFIAKGNVDQMPANAMADPNNLLMQQEDGSFVERSDDAGVATTERSRGAAMTDFNLDGLLDLVVVNRRAPLELWQNQTSSDGNWLGLSVRQEVPNTFAVGAWVEVRDALGRHWSQEITVGGGHGGGDAGPLHFGLGTSVAAEVRVHWPEGAVSPWLALAANRYVDLHRQAGNAVAMP